MSFGPFVLARWVGMLPGTVLYRSSGSLSKAVAAPQDYAGPWQRVLFWLGLAATAAVTAVLVRIARRALREELDPASH